MFTVYYLLYKLAGVGLIEEFKICKNRYIHYYQFEIFAIKAAEKKENNKKIYHIFHHNFKNIPCYVMSEVSLKRVYFPLFDDGLTLKIWNWRLSVFAFKLFSCSPHVHHWQIYKCDMLWTTITNGSVF